MEVYKGHLDTAGDLKLKQITKYKNIFITWVSLFPFKKWALWPGDPNYVKINKYILNCGPLIYNLWNFNFLKGISEIINFSMIFYFFLIFWKGSVFGIFCILIIMTYSNHNYFTFPIVCNESLICISHPKFNDWNKLFHDIIHWASKHKQSNF